MILSAIFFVLISAPTDPASKLLEEYLSIRTDHSGHGTAEAAKMWMREAKFVDMQTTTWTLDASGKCVHFIARLPASVESSGRPIVLLHHADTVSATESEWSHPPFRPEWVQAQYDWELYGRGAIEGKGPGVIHWMALRSVLDKPRNRDLYFVMNCGEETGDPLGAKAFVNYFIRALPGFDREISTVEKLEMAGVLGKFSNLPQVEWIWNEGSFGDKTQLAPYTLAPVATSQKGHWLGEVTISRKTNLRSPLEALMAGTQKLYKSNSNFREKFRSLHTEMDALVSEVSKTRPFWQRILLYIYPRLLFESTGLQSLVTSWWMPSNIHSSTGDPSLPASSVTETLEYRFLGEKEISEIERGLQKAFEPELGEGLELKIVTKDYSPFRRDFFRGSEADIFKNVLGSYPKVIVTPFITPAVTDSRFFRMAGVRAFDFTPLFLSQAEMATVRGADERMPHSELMRAVEIESAILEKLLQ